ncbi:unnamed protein product [Natator depressus]
MARLHLTGGDVIAGSAVPAAAAGLRIPSFAAGGGGGTQSQDRAPPAGSGRLRPPPPCCARPPPQHPPRPGPARPPPTDTHTPGGGGAAPQNNGGRALTDNACCLPASLPLSKLQPPPPRTLSLVRDPDLPPTPWSCPPPPGPAEAGLR